jgi:hypothetical protein
MRQQPENNRQQQFRIITPDMIISAAITVSALSGMVYWLLTGINPGPFLWSLPAAAIGGFCYLGARTAMVVFEQIRWEALQRENQAQIQGQNLQQQQDFAIYKNQQLKILNDLKKNDFRDEFRKYIDKASQNIAASMINISKEDLIELVENFNKNARDEKYICPISLERVEEPMLILGANGFSKIIDKENVIQILEAAQNARPVNQLPILALNYLTNKPISDENLKYFHKKISLIFVNMLQLFIKIKHYVKK